MSQGYTAIPTLTYALVALVPIIITSWRFRTLLGHNWVYSPHFVVYSATQAAVITSFTLLNLSARNSSSSSASFAASGSPTSISISHTSFRTHSSSLSTGAKSGIRIGAAFGPLLLISLVPQFFFRYGKQKAAARRNKDGNVTKKSELAANEAMLRRKGGAMNGRRSLLKIGGGERFEAEGNERGGLAMHELPIETLVEAQ